MKHKGFKRYVSILLAVILVMGMLPLSILTASAFVADLTYYTASWDDSTGEVITTGASLPEGAVDLTVKYPGLPYAITFENGGFYYVSHSCTYNERAAVSGHATLFIPDGVALEFRKGITLSQGSTLTVCGGELSTGELHANANSDDCAGIGGMKDGNCGSLIVMGGQITARGGTDAAGIGGGDEGSLNGDVVVYRGVICTYGGKYGAGIGGGYYGKMYNLTVYGGWINAYGGKYGAGIGGGEGGSQIGTITV